MNTLLILTGLALILLGANYLTDGAAALAKRLSISEFVIGLTIVAIGTSAPELVVSLLSALEGNGVKAIGNVVGSNLFNTYVILGICALFVPVTLTRRNMIIDIPFGIVVSVILLFVTLSGTIERMFGVVMLLIYLAIILFSIKSSKRDSAIVEEASEVKSVTLWLSVVMVIGGLVGLICGGNLFLEGAENIARQFGIPDNIIAITLLAGGTSFPELAASIVSIAKGKSDIALGGVIGSNIANILLVLGLSATITPLGMGSITLYDILMVLLGSVLVYITGHVIKKNYISRVEGALMLILYGLYMTWLLS